MRQGHPRNHEIINVAPKTAIGFRRPANQHGATVTIGGSDELRRLGIYRQTQFTRSFVKYTDIHMPISIHRRPADFGGTNCTIWRVVAIKSRTKAFGTRGAMHHDGVEASGGAFGPIRHRESVGQHWRITTLHLFTASENQCLDVVTINHHIRTGHGHDATEARAIGRIALQRDVIKTNVGNPPTTREVCIGQQLAGS